MMERPRECTICHRQWPDGMSWEPYSANYCTSACKAEAGRRYDAYVDPYGAYAGKAERELEEY